MTSRQVDFTVLQQSQKIFPINGANAIVSADSNSESLVVATDIGLPVLINFRAESIKTFQNPKNVKFNTPTAIGINQHSDLIVTGHSDGSVCIFSVKDNYSLTTTFQDHHKSAITAIAFCPRENDFYVGDASGLTTRISFGKIGKIVTKILTEKEINRDTHPVTKIFFTKENCLVEAGFVVMTDHFILIDPEKSPKEQVTGRSGNFDMNPSVVLYEGLHGNLDIFAFTNNVCHYYTINNASYLNYSGKTVLFNNSSEIVTNAMIWSSRMIVLITNFAVCKFVNIRDLSLSIERSINEYEEYIVERRQSPLSQVILSQSLYTSANNNYLYCVHPRKVIKMNFSSWENKVLKSAKEGNYDAAFKLIINTIRSKEMDAIGLSDRVSDQNLAIKQITESTITQYLQYAFETKEDNVIEKSIMESVRISSRISIQKFVIDEIIPMINKAGYIKIFYQTLFQSRAICPHGYMNPTVIKMFLSYCQENNDIELAERSLMRIPIPKNYANDIASIIYDFGLIGIFSKIMVFSFQDFITPCVVLEDDFEKFKLFLEFIYNDSTLSLRKLTGGDKAGPRSERREKRERFRKSMRLLKPESKPDIDWNEIDKLNKKYNRDDHDFHGPPGHDHDHDFHGPPGHDHDHGHGPPGRDHDHDLGHSHGSSQLLDYADTNDDDNEEGQRRRRRFGRFRDVSAEEQEKRQQMKLLAQRTICLWIFCPTSLLGFARLERIIKNDLQLATTILDCCADLLPLKYAPNNEFNTSYFADSVMQVISQLDDEENIADKYEKYLPILNIVCPLYEEPEVEITRCALQLTTRWCFCCQDQPQTTRIAIINKIRSKYQNLISEEDFRSFSIAAGFKFAIEDAYLSQKRYDIVVQSMISNPEDRQNIFEFLNDHIEDREEISKAILENVEGLVLLDSDSLYSFVSKLLPELNTQIINKLDNDLQKYLYLSSFNEADEARAKPYYDELFALICKYHSSMSILFFQEHQADLNIEKAKEVCNKYHITDCLVMIAKASDNQDEAILSVERELIDVLELDGIEKVKVNSEQQLGQYLPLIQALNAVDALLDYQKETIQKEGITSDEIAEKNIGEKIAHMKFFKAFNFPFYVSREKPASVRKILFLLFAHFVIGSMDYIPVKMLFTLMFIYVRQFDFDEICEILAQVSDEIEFKERRSESLLQMGCEDTCHLIDDVFKYITKGRKSSINVCCSSCLKQLSPPKYGDILIFPCGHMFHDEETCWQDKDEKGMPCRPDECPICSKGNNLTETLEVQVPNTTKKLSNNQVNLILRRIGFALKKNYGADVDEYRPSSVYFSVDERDIADAILVPQKIQVPKPVPINLSQ